MPQRTNAFQQVVHMISSALSPQGAKITESAMVPGLKGMREIDVLIETPAGHFVLKVAVEAKDHKRKLTVQAVEEVLGKYSGVSGIKVDRVVIVAQRGFTKEARARAEAEKIELLVLSKIEPGDWTKLAPQNLVFEFPLHICRLRLVPSVDAIAGLDPIQVGRFVCRCHGFDKGSPREWAEWLLKEEVIPNRELRASIEQEAKERGGEVKVHVPMPVSDCKCDLWFAGKIWPINTLEVELHLLKDSSNVRWQGYDLRKTTDHGKTLDQLEANLCGRNLRVMFPEGMNSQRIIVRFDKADARRSDDPGPKHLQFKTQAASAPPWRRTGRRIVNYKGPSEAVPSLGSFGSFVVGSGVGPGS